MRKSTNFILTLLIFILVFSLPCLAYGLKLDLNKKALRIDKKRYAEVNYVCFEKKSSDDCVKFLKEDLGILMKAHKDNKEFCRANSSFTKPDGFIKYAYKIRENKISIEPEIFLKTMLIKRMLFVKLNKPIESGMFGEEMENYIVKNFSEPNRSAYLRALADQDEDFDKQLKKIQFVNTRKVIGPTPAYQSLSYDF